MRSHLSVSSPMCAVLSMLRLFSPDVLAAPHPSGLSVHRESIDWPLPTVCPFSGMDCLGFGRIFLCRGQAVGAVSSTTPSHSASSSPGCSVCSPAPAEALGDGPSPRETWRSSWLLLVASASPGHWVIWGVSQWTGSLSLFLCHLVFQINKICILLKKYIHLLRNACVSCQQA